MIAAETPLVVPDREVFTKALSKLAWANEKPRKNGRNHRSPGLNGPEAEAIFAVLRQHAWAIQLLRRYEYAAYGKHVQREGHGACMCCGWPQEGHRGAGRIKGNRENTHQEGCSLDAILHGWPAPRLDTMNDPVDLLEVIGARPL